MGPLLLVVVRLQWLGGSGGSGGSSGSGGSGDSDSGFGFGSGSGFDLASEMCAALYNPQNIDAFVQNFKIY